MVNFAYKRGAFLRGAYPYHDPSLSLIHILLGAAVEASGVPRKTLFLASKVPQNDLGYDRLLYHCLLYTSGIGCGSAGGVVCSGVLLGRTSSERQAHHESQNKCDPSE